MAEKTILGRIIQKHDIEANWNLATDFIPKQGEIIVYDIDENYTYERFKIGDGVTNITELPFTSATPDWSVNDPNAAGYIENRTHWVGTAEAPLTFDGDTTGKEVVEMGGGAYLVKMSDTPKTAEELIGSTLIIKQTPTEHNDYSGPVFELVIDETIIFPTYDSDVGSIIAVVIVYSSGDDTAYVFSVQGDISETGFSLSEGVYFAYGRRDDTYVYAHSLSCLTGPQEVVHKLDKKYLPDFVSTINGQTPDANGNVDIDSKAIIDVTELPTENINENAFYKLNTSNELYTYNNNGWVKNVSAYENPPLIDLHWDGVIGDKEVIDGSVTNPNIPSGTISYVKISNNAFTKEQLIGSQAADNLGNNITITSSDFIETGISGYIALINGLITIISSAEEVNSMLGQSLFTNGTYFTYYSEDEGVRYFTSLTSPSTITKIDSKYLDVNVPTKTSELTNDSGFITASEIPDADVPTKISELENDAGYISVTSPNGENRLELPEATTITSSMVLGLHGDTVSISGGSGSAAINIDFENTITVTGDMQVQEPTNDNSVVNKKYIDDCFEDVDVPSNVSAFINDAGYLNTTTGSDGNPLLSLPEMTTISSNMVLGLHGDMVSITDSGNTSSIVLDGMGGAQLNGDFHVQTPIANESIANKKYVDDSVAGLVDSAPATLNTLKELSAALGNDENFATTVATQIGELETEIESVESRLPTAISSLRNDSGYITIDDVANEVYVGDGDMPEDAKVQFIMDGSDEEELLKDNLTQYIDNKLTDFIPKNQGSANVGKILVVGADGNLTLGDIPESISGDVIGTIDENNNIVITGNLADGTYVFKYEGTNGLYTDIGSLVVGGLTQYSIITTLTDCTAVSGNTTVINEGGTVTLKYVAKDGFKLTNTVTVNGASYTWDATTGTLVLSNPISDITITITATKSGYTNIIDTVGYTDGYRLSTTSGSLSQQDGYTSTGTISISNTMPMPVTIRTKGVNFNKASQCAIVLYRATGEKASSSALYGKENTAFNGLTWNFDADGNMTMVYDSQYGIYFKICGYGSGANLIVTINEEITG